MAPYSGLPVPRGATNDAAEAVAWYDDFAEHAYLAPHQDGSSILVFWPLSESDRVGAGDDFAEDQVMQDFVAIYRFLLTPRDTTVRQFNDHPRLVSCLEIVSPICLRLDRLRPGPLSHTSLPALKIPLARTVQPLDRTMLFLYYRWAIQILSALSYLHSRAVFHTNLDYKSVWIRKDYSIALTGFVYAAVPQIDEKGNVTYPERHHHSTTEGVTFSSNGKGSPPCAETDLFDWATLVWRLMTNDFRHGNTDDFSWHEPVIQDPNDPYSKYRTGSEHTFEEIEEARLGKILIKAWKGGYQTAEQVMQDVSSVARSAGAKIGDTDDEVLSPIRGKNWEDIFTAISKPDGPGARTFAVEIHFAEEMHGEKAS